MKFAPILIVIASVTFIVYNILVGTFSNIGQVIRREDRDLDEMVVYLPEPGVRCYKLKWYPGTFSCVLKDD